MIRANQPPEDSLGGNLEEHEIFETFCALSLAGGLSSADDTRLAGHLKECVACRSLLEEFGSLTLEVLPVIGGAMHEEQSVMQPYGNVDQAAEKRLLEAIDIDAKKKPLPFEPKESLSSRWKRAGSLAAVLVLGLGAGAGLMRGYLLEQLRIKEPDNTTVRIETVLDQDSATRLLEAKKLLAVAEERSLALQMKIRGANKSLEQQRDSGQILQRQLEEDQFRFDALAQQKSDLSAQLAATTGQAQQLRAINAQHVTEESARMTKLNEVEGRIKDLHAALDQKDRALQEDAELLAHDQDIRDLIGARNVYMAEVYDVAETGRTNKPFGRVFYTRDKSLIFYGYDLDRQPNLKQAVVFQGWGASSEGQNINMGLFYQDESKKRWILKFNDAKTLARLNSVFVTVEPKGGSNRPTGKPLLSTYLRLEPNHP